MRLDDARDGPPLLDGEAGRQQRQGMPQGRAQQDRGGHALGAEPPGADLEIRARSREGGIDHRIHGQTRDVAQDRIDVVQGDLALPMGIEHELGQFAPGREAVAAEAREQGRARLAATG